MNSKKDWADHITRSFAYSKAVEKLFQAAIKEAIRIGYTVEHDADKAFTFANFPQTKLRAQKLFKDLAEKIHTYIETGVQREWMYSNAGNDSLVDQVLSTFKLPKEIVEGYKNRNLESLAAFQTRKVNGMNLSGRVWNLTQQLKSELEMAIDIGLGEGRTAQHLSQDVRQYLQAPDKLFRRVRDKRGQLQLSKAAKNYHPGRGVYRSSFKNAHRLTRTETNMGYHSADHERWSQLDFVVGIKVSRSNNVTDCDLCDAFVGIYPKAYVFIGNHPHCMCHATPIMATREEMDRLFEAKLAGNDTSGFRSQNKVTKMPQGYMDWIKNNEKRILKASSIPYFIKDNYRGGDVTKGLRFM